MKIAIFSDVHGNLAGLEAVISEIDRIKPDEVVVAGDLCMMGPRPAECLALLRSRNIAGVYGNTDEWLLDRQPPPDHMIAATAWAKERLDASAINMLGDLPFQIRYSPTGNSDDDLLIVHANPRDVNKIIFPSEPDQLEYYGRIRQADAELEPLLAGLEAAVLAFGHLHIPGIRWWRTTRLVNVSSVSLPGDHDPRSKFVVFTWTSGGWQIEHFRVSYDLEAEANAFRHNPIPGWDEAMRSMETQRYIPQRV